MRDFTAAIVALGENVVIKLKGFYLEDADEELPYQFTEVISDYTGGSEHYLTRVVESIKIEFLPEDIVLEDVTDRFKI